jgi:phospholipid/cholesterol/gamma-HCH transport system permease protein
MEKPADFSVVRSDGGAVTAELTGDWTSRCLADAGDRLADALVEAPAANLDLSKVSRCDTAGAYSILKAGRSRNRRITEGLTARPQTLKLIQLVADTLEAEPVKPPRPGGLNSMMDRLGRGMIDVWLDFVGTMAFNGRLLVSTARAIINPRRIRWAPFFSLAERAGLDALPIISVTSFFIGAVIALLAANMLAQFGAQVFAVELIGIAVLREFAIVITAILLAGRSASAFAAEIGSMKMTQEVDAMQVLGVDPFEALVLPRFMALLFTIPILTFVAALAGLAGGMLVSWSVLDLSPDFFLRRIVENVGVTHFFVGLSKAPVMAIVVAAIGCRQGMEVGVDVESLGRRVTAAVVHAIFSIIFIDAVFALLYMELNV